MKHNMILTIALLSLFMLAACNSSDESSFQNGEDTVGNTQSVAANLGTHQTLSIDEFAEIMDQRSDEYTIINVHIPYAGEIEGTNANIAYNDIDALTATVPEKNTPIILYCRSGNMSEQATRALLGLGYTQIWDVPGGMNAWQSSGRDLLDVD